MKKNIALLHDAKTNKSTAFTREERENLGLRGLLPYAVSTQQRQVGRILENMHRKTSEQTELLVDTHVHTHYSDGLAGVPRIEADLAEAGRLILDVLARAKEPMTEAELDGAIEFRRQAWKRALRDLVAAGRVIRAGRGGKAEPFRYSGSHSIPGNQGTRTLFPDLRSEDHSEDSGSRVPHRVVVPEVPS